MSMQVVVDNESGDGRRPPAPRSGRRTRHLQSAAPAVTTLRRAVAADAPRLFALIASHLEEGRLLPRALDELSVHAARFVVATQPSRTGGRIVGCAELAPLSGSVAEVRSLVVAVASRRLGLGHQMVEELSRRARREGFSRLCAFAHEPAFFVRQGFSIVPHTWVPEKIVRDCRSCPLFRTCDQFATVLDLTRQRISANTAVMATHG